MIFEEIKDKALRGKVGNKIKAFGALDGTIEGQWVKEHRAATVMSN
jgi:hypothetical protein